MPFRLGPWHIGVILLIILIIFGVGRLPQIGGAIGKGIREYGTNRSNCSGIVNKKSALAVRKPDYMPTETWAALRSAIASLCMSQ